MAKNRYKQYIPIKTKLNNSRKVIDKIVKQFTKEHGQRGYKTAIISFNKICHMYNNLFHEITVSSIRRWNLKHELLLNYNSIEYVTRKGFKVDIVGYIQERIEEERDTELSETDLKRLPYYEG